MTVKFYPITPQPAPRIGPSKWSKSAKRYYKYKDDLRLLNVYFPPRGARIIFTLPMPKSWSRKKRMQMCGKPHESKPDLKNLIAALEDAIYENDQIISEYRHLSKCWGESGMITIGFDEKFT